MRYIINFVGGKSSLGSLKKAIYNINGQDYMVKANTENGYEGLSEVLGSRICKFMVDQRVLEYRLFESEYFNEIRNNSKFEYVSGSKLYRSKLTNFQKFLRMESEAGELIGIKDDFDEILKHYNLDLNYIYSALIVDAVIGNIDRHPNNFDVEYIDDKLVFGPILDFGQSLLFCCPEEQLDHVGINTYDNSNFIFGKTHEDEIKYLKNKYGIRKLVKCNLNSFGNFVLNENEDLFSLVSKKRASTIKGYVINRYIKYAQQFEM